MPKAFVFNEYGGPQVQSFVDLPKPTPGPGQVLIAVRAAGVNPFEWKVREGYLSAYLDISLPVVPGSELAGVVDQVGEGVAGFARGDEVFGGHMFGAFAEYVVLDAQAVAHKPVIGAASDAKKDLVESLGAVHVPYGEGELDRIRAVAPEGAWMPSSIWWALPDVEATAQLLKDPSKLVTTVDPGAAAKLGGAMVDRVLTGERYAAVAVLLESGVLEPIVTALPFEKAGDALAQLQAGHTTGKIVLEVG